MKTRTLRSGPAARSPTAFSMSWRSALRCSATYIRFASPTNGSLTVMSLGRGGRIGALIPGRRADIVVLDTDDERELAYRMGAPLIAEVYASGRRVA